MDHSSSKSYSLGPLLVIVAISTIVVTLSFTSVEVPGLSITSSTQFKAGRSIASVEETSSVTRFAKPQKLDFDCSKAGSRQEVDVEATHVQIQLRCGGVNFDANPITNINNGFTAATLSGDKGLMTDFIDLKEGLNEIKIGSKLLVVKRRPASF